MGRWAWNKAQAVAKYLLDRWDRWAAGKTRWQIAYKLGLAGAAALMAFLLPLILGVYLGVFGPLPNYGELKNIRNNQASEVYAEDGVVLGKYYIENRSNTSLDEIAEPVLHGLVATEDARFFQHGGIDLRAWVRVLVKTMLLFDESSGGGSTLSQQLAKNLFPRRRYWLLGTPINKIREMFTARRLEKVYTKEELLNLYLNTVPFGENVYGIKVAAHRFFNKTPDELKIEEAAVLVGMLKGNTLYNPYRNPERALERRNVVIKQMQRYGYLTEGETDSLKALPMTIDYQKEGNNEGLATYFREHLRQELEDILADYRKPDGSAYNLYTDGLKIYTTINSRMQQYAEEAVSEYMPKVQDNFNRDWAKGEAWGGEEALEQALLATDRYKTMREQGYSNAKIRKTFEEPIRMTIFDWEEGTVDTLMSPLDSLKYYLSMLNTGLLAAEPQTGLVRAWVGGTAHRFIKYDHVKSRRPVGSTIKPVVYAQALRSGMLPCEYTPNQQTTYDQYNGYSPRNSDGDYGGAYSIQGALAKSINTVAVSVGIRAGLDNVATLARQMGINKGRIKAMPALALGAVEASLMEMVQVYSGFAARGVRPGRLHYLDRIETADGKKIVSFPRPGSKSSVRVLEPDVADIMITLMQSVVDSGTARKLRYEFGLGGAVAGKTGTTQNQADGWFMGFTPRLAVGVWVGSDNPAAHFRSLSRGQASSTALPIWGGFMRKVSRDGKLKSWRGGAFPTLSDSLAAYLQCPPYLPEMPVMEDYLDMMQNPSPEEEAPIDLRALPAEFIQPIINANPRQPDEAPADYEARILRLAEKEYRRQLRRQRRQDFWNKLNNRETPPEGQQ